MIEEAEAFLADNGFKQYRVRHHGTVARIEVDESEIKKVIEAVTRKRLRISSVILVLFILQLIWRAILQEA